MSEQARLEDLKTYSIMDSPPEKGLDEIVEIALSIFDTPVALLTFLDAERQWFKAARGTAVKEIPRKHSFCNAVLSNGEDVHVIGDLLEDDRYRENPFVREHPGIRFYAGAPLKTPDGNVLGTLCIMDFHPRIVHDHKKHALKLLASKAMDYLNNRKRLIEQAKSIELDADKLKKLTDLAPGIFFQFVLGPEGKKIISFISEAITRVHPHLDAERLMDMPEIALQVVHPDDVVMVQESIQHSLSSLAHWNIEFKVISSSGKVQWYCGNAKPEKQKDGTVVWYGTLQDINTKKKYEEILEQILFDISHVIRHPVTKMLGITSLINEETLDESQLKRYAENLKAVSEEMDAFTKRLNIIYSRKRRNSL